ncbi:hypothetical protein [Petrocella sp. FN5]|uniref:hypothetical protein n=1 Tax=Petrocella sp. FN5 TaxID=3032002 RepID=UPI0023DBCE4F|nr:hypothetical protein [Petrocella sp. FN5]MDF1617305.1 hypothetical protein [Petrocella sp. FN5]
MGEAIWSIISKLAEVFDKNYDTKKAIKIIFILVISGVIVITAYSYFSMDYRIATRIENLDKLSQIDIELIKSNPELHKEYKSILNDIGNRYFWENINLSKINIIGSGKANGMLKFVTGGSIWFLILLFTPFIYKSLKEFLIAFFLFIVMGCIFGYISYVMPTFIVPMVNYIGSPVLQLTIFIWLMYKGDKKKKKK